MKIHIATNREVGERCKHWAMENLPKGFTYTDNPDEADIYISILSLKLLKEEFINSKKACFNFHPGLLPMYRGSGICTWVILNGDKKSGVTLHRIDPGIDTGNVIANYEVDVLPHDTAETLFHKKEIVIYHMFMAWFPRLLQELPVGTPQPKEGRTYTRKMLDNARDITKLVKAFEFKGKPGLFFKSPHRGNVEIHYEKD